MTLDGYGVGQDRRGVDHRRDHSGESGDGQAEDRAGAGPLAAARSLGPGWSEFRGKKGNLDVSIRLKSQGSGRTRVEVTSRAGPTNYDKGMAQQILDEIGKS